MSRLPNDLIPFAEIERALSVIPVRVVLTERDLVLIGYRRRTPLPNIRKSRKHGSTRFWYRRNLVEWFSREFSRTPELVAAFVAALNS